MQSRSHIAGAGCEARALPVLPGLLVPRAGEVLAQSWKLFMERDDGAAACAQSQGDVVRHDWQCACQTQVEWGSPVNSAKPGQLVLIVQFLNLGKYSPTSVSFLWMGTLHRALHCFCIVQPSVLEFCVFPPITPGDKDGSARDPISHERNPTPRGVSCSVQGLRQVGVEIYPGSF